MSAPVNQLAYRWSTTSSLDNPSIYNPIASPVFSTLYIVEIIDQIIGENLILNSDFSAGDVGFESEYFERIFEQGLYGITDSAKKLNGIYFTDCLDHTDGSGLMMVVDGSPIAGLKVWCQSIEVKADTQYAFSTWLSSVLGSNPAELQFSINGEPLGFSFRAVEEVCQWRQFYQLWQSEENTQAEICIVNRNTDPDGNDFALDDFLFVEIGNISYDSTLVIIDNFQFIAQLVQLPNCGESDGIISINPKGFGGRLSYSTDGITFSEDRVITDIGKGSYDIYAMDMTNADSDFNVCLFDTTIVVNQQPCPIYIPSTFSIGSERNGLFTISPHPEFTGRLLKLSIFDRWGSHMYTTEDHDAIKKGWNGKKENHQLVSSGIYSYRLDLIHDDGNQPTSSLG